METKIKQNNKSKINKWMYFCGIRLVVFYTKFRFKFKIDKSEIKKLKGAHLVLGNHTSSYDFAFFSGGMMPKPLNFVVAYNMFYHNAYSKLFRMYHAIPKHQFASDFHCIKEIKKNLDSGINVMLFPEGRITPDGTTGYIAPSIGKLVKWLGYPVIIGKTSGGYVSRPKWGKKRSAPVKIKMKQILSKEDIAKSSIEEINNVIFDCLQYNDNVSLIESGKKIKGNALAEGLEKLLYKCPNCGAEFYNKTSGNELWCSKCLNRVVYNKNSLITAKGGDKVFDRVDLWFDFQKQAIKKEIENSQFEMKDQVNVSITNDETHLFEIVGQGELRLSFVGLNYTGECCGKSVELTFPIETMPTVPYIIGKSLDTNDGVKVYRFSFLNRMPSVKYVLAVEELYRQSVETKAK
ncbi:MAG: lysophospholipid acyltransferase family protein [Clostridia bacterium]